MTRRFSTDAAMAAALLADAEKLEALGQDAGPSLQDLALYDGIECDPCAGIGVMAQAVCTDVNGLDLCAECAAGCKLPEMNA